jgi:hypothetical protein
MKVTIFNTNIDTEINSSNYHQTFYGALNRQFRQTRVRRSISNLQVFHKVFLRIRQQ